MTNSFEQKHYTKVIRYGKSGTQGLLNPGDEIVIYEKVDGSNASFAQDTGVDKVRRFSRKLELTEDWGLNGFVEWTIDCIDGQALLPDVLYFGEWTAPHKVRYAEEFTRTYFLFDLYDTKTQKYLPYETVELEALRLGLKLAPVLYRGEFIDFEHLMSFVGKTALGGHVGDKEGGEGIVVKKVNDKDQVFLKLVDEAFLEVHNSRGSKQKVPKDPNKASAERAFVNATVTEARVDKILYKLSDEGVLPDVLVIQDMGDILKAAGNVVYQDIMEEEADELLPADHEKREVRRAVGGVLPQIVKQVLKARGTL
ncbi:RNA ligase [Bacillus phage Taffo16]|uniref:RNA ligase n=1 Tax=Bacillus phage Taffo16 TaxID=2030094 RepID=A0A249XVH0_9CAUD|nr:RNA ligase [Bacillus phage Taffo16]